MNAKPPQTTDQEAEPYHEKQTDMVQAGETYNPEEEREVLRKIDMAVLPMVSHTHTQSLPSLEILGNVK
jgi:hypothetical protein